MQIKKIHFVGIKGVGMTPLAIIAKEAGMEITGSDVGKDYITDTALQQVGIDGIYKNFSSAHVQEADLVITTVAHAGLQNPEVIAAKEKGIPVWTQAEAVGKFMNGAVFGTSYTGISVTGTHGKTTTTAMVSTLLQQADQDPSYVIGTSYIPSLKPHGLPGNLGKGNYFVAEADEYVGEFEENGEIKKQTRFLWQHPLYLIMTSLEFDHPDVYGSVADVEKSFLQFAMQLPKEGVLIFHGDDSRLQKIARQVSCKKVSYGFGTQNDFSVRKVTEQPGGNEVVFTFEHNEAVYSTLFSIQVEGDHNILNASAAIALGCQLKMNFELIRDSIKMFKGSKRRLEKIISRNQNLPKEYIYYDDYAHHPTEIKATLKTLRFMYPEYCLVCIFQPHTYSRTKALFTEFTHAFENADEVIFTDIFSSAREKEDRSVSSELLTHALVAAGANAVYMPSLTDVIEYIQNHAYPLQTIIVAMGAGDVYTIFEEYHSYP